MYIKPVIAYKYAKNQWDTEIYTTLFLIIRVNFLLIISVNHHDNEVFPDSDYRVILPECFYNTVQIKWDFPIDISSA